MPRNPNDLNQPAPNNGPGFINPYNFVRFGKPASRKAAPGQEKFAGLSGRIECEIELLTPLCIPDAEASGDDPNNPERKVKRFSRVNGQPYISATELKGAIRSVAEAVSGSCLSILSQHFYIYRDNRGWVPGSKKIGKLIPSSSGPFQLEAPTGINQNTHPPVFPRRGLLNQDGRSYNPRGFSKNEGNLWTGANELIPDEVRELYDTMVKSDDFQLGEEPVRPGQRPNHWRDRGTWDEKDADRWKVDYHNRHKTALASPFWWFRKISLPADPRNPGGPQVEKVAQIGRNFRYKWAYHIKNAIPQPFQPCENVDQLCPACRLFGMVSGEESSADQAEVNAVAGRVMFSPAKWIGGQPRIEFVEALKILNSPKASCRSFYLNPRKFIGNLSVKEDEFMRLDRTGKLVSAPGRGRKFYWHQTKVWSGENLSYIQMMKVRPTDADRPKNKLNSDIEVLMPERSQNSFAFEVSFENLVEEELGLLLWSLALPEGSGLAHHIGLGKPLGLGSAKIKVKQVQLIDRKRRYENLFKLGLDQPEMLPESQRLARAIDLFRQQVKAQNGVGAFDQAPNVADLLVILDTRQPAPAGLQVKISYPPGLADVDQEPGQAVVNPEEVHHTWFGVKGWQWAQRLLTIAEIAEGMRQRL